MTSTRHNEMNRRHAIGALAVLVAAAWFALPAHTAEAAGADDAPAFAMNPGLVNLADNTWRKLEPRFVYHPDQLGELEKKGVKLEDLPQKAGGKFCHVKGEGSFCYDESANVTLYYGGCTSGYGNNHWVYDCSKNTWTQISPDIFELDGVWRYRKDPKTVPPGCCSYGICYDAERQVSVIARPNGGATSWKKEDGPPNNHAWLYDAAAKKWLFTEPNGKVPDAYMTGTRLAYDPVKKECLLYSGLGRSIWAYKTASNTWRKVETGDPRPGKGGMASWVYLDKEKKFLLFGGRLEKSGDPNTTWLYDPATEKWENVTPKDGPGTREGAAMAYDSAHNVAVMIGGWSEKPSVKLDDGTWVFDPAARTWTRHALDPTPKVSGNCYQMSYDKVNNVFLYVTNGITWVYRYKKDAK